MGVEIKSEHIDIGGSNVVLASVRGGKAVIGTCSAGYGAKRGDTSAQTRLFYIGNEPVAEILCPNHGSKSSDKLISLCTGYSAMDDEIHDTLTESSPTGFTRSTIPTTTPPTEPVRSSGEPTISPTRYTEPPSTTTPSAGARHSAPAS